jgi:hypothetical protein
VKRTYSRHGVRDEHNHELTYWSEKLGLPIDQLRKAVIKEGSMKKAVESRRLIASLRRKGPLRLKVLNGRRTYYR